MSEAQTSGTKPKKMVRRKVAFALGLVCIVLIAFIAYLTITGISAQNSCTSLQNQNKQLQAWLDGNATLLNQIQAGNADLTRQIAEQNNTIFQLESNITELQNQIAIANATIASLKNSIISTVKMVSVTKDDWWYSTFHLFNFTVQVANNRTDTVKDIAVVIGLYHDWMNVSWPVANYTNEIESYQSPKPGPGVNTLYFGTIPAGGNGSRSIFFSIGDICLIAGEGTTVPVDYAVATLFLGNITLDKQTLQINETVAGKQTWVFP